MDKTKKRLPTHLFLAELGKTRLRPGGKEATDRIIESCKITSDTKVLEVAPNMGTTAIYLAEKYQCHVTGVDLHKPSIEKAQKNIKEKGLEHLITIQRGNAVKLPFEDEAFDVVINEAMLSMLPLEQKKKAVSEYFRVLKPGGKLVTHDLLLFRGPDQDHSVDDLLADLRKILHVNARPMVAKDWKAIFDEAGFSEVTYHTGKMTLLSLKGLIVDEGWEGTIKILENARKDPDSMDYLFQLIKTFDDNSDLYGHITFSAQK